MQYLLREQEYHLLKNEQAIKYQIEIDELQRLCTLAAKYIPVKRDWEDKDAKQRPWGCILIADSIAYCDKCPVQILCPNRDKYFSK